MLPTTFAIKFNFLSRFWKLSLTKIIIIIIIITFIFYTLYVILYPQIWMLVQWLIKSEYSTKFSVKRKKENILFTFDTCCLTVNSCQNLTIAQIISYRKFIIRKIKAQELSFRHKLCYKIVFETKLISFLIADSSNKQCRHIFCLFFTIAMLQNTFYYWQFQINSMVRCTINLQLPYP